MGKLIKQVVVGFLAVVLLFGAKGYYDTYAAMKSLEQQNSALIHVNDSTQARVAKLRGDKEMYEALYETEKVLNGKLVAAASITVPADTVIRYRDRVVTVTDSTGTRTAQVQDTSENGIGIKIDVEAPPFPADLAIGYEITTPEFKPQVGFLRTGETYTAVVTWAGQRYTLEDAFYAPEKQWPLSLRFGIEATGSPAENAALGARVSGRVFGAVQFDLPKAAFRLETGYAGEKYLSLRAERKVSVPVLSRR